MIRVFVADDHAVVRAGLRQILEAQGMSVPVEGAVPPTRCWPGSRSGPRTSWFST